jgi:hypothetical protein
MKAQNTAFGHGGKATGGGNATPTLVDTYDKLKNNYVKRSHILISKE